MVATRRGRRSARRRGRAGARLRQWGRRADVTSSDRTRGAMEQARQSDLNYATGLPSVSSAEAAGVVAVVLLIRLASSSGRGRSFLPRLLLMLNSASPTGGTGSTIRRSPNTDTPTSTSPQRPDASSVASRRSTRSRSCAVRVASGLSTFYSAVLVSISSLTGASILLYLLGKREFGDRGRAATVVLLANLFPTSHFGHAPYSESLFLLLLAAYLVVVRAEGSFLLSSLLGAFLVFTRAAGVAVMPLHVVVAVKRVRHAAVARNARRRRPSRRRVRGTSSHDAAPSRPSRVCGAGGVAVLVLFRVPYGELLVSLARSSARNSGHPLCC